MIQSLGTGFFDRFASVFNETFRGAYTLYHQALGQVSDSANVKRDGSVVTPLDRRLGSLFKDSFQASFPNAAVVSEDQEVSGPRQSPKARRPELIFLIDPIDGSRPYSIGAATSTVIVSAVDPAKKTFITAQIGDLATGRVISLKDEGVFLSSVGEGLRRDLKLQVSGQPLGSNSSIFLDCSRGFRDVLSDNQADRVVSTINGLGRLAMFGSNGQHHFLVALGQPGAVGGLTLAVGGPWDLGGAAIITKAGGTCRALRIKDGAIVKDDCDPLNPFSYNALIYGNSPATVDKLYLALRAALTAG